MTIGGEDANRTQLHHGNPRRHRRRRGGPVRPRPLRNVQALRRGQALEGRGPRHERRPSWAASRKSSSASTAKGVYRELQYESGGHRVQRVPETEAKGRIHTSAATVAVMPEPEDVEIDIKPDDYRKDMFRASGPGGQHVNKTASAIRLTHYETRHRRVSARTKRASTRTSPRPCACSRPGSTKPNARQNTRNEPDERKTLIGSGDRSERIRTYNFPENRVTDHRINLTLYKLDSILAGNVQPRDRCPDRLRPPATPQGHGQRQLKPLRSMHSRSSASPRGV